MGRVAAPKLPPLPSDPLERDVALLCSTVWFHSMACARELELREKAIALLNELSEVREIRLRLEGEEYSTGEVSPGLLRGALDRVRARRLADDAQDRRDMMLEVRTPGERAFDAFARLSEKRQAHAWAEVGR